MYYKRVLMFLATGSAPWYSNIWADKSHVTDIWELKSGQANVTIEDEITNMEHMFYHCSNLTSLDLFSQFNTTKVTNMGGMFNSCSSLTTLDLSAFNTSKVTNMSWMFFNCHGLASLDLSNFDTSNVTDMDSMFNSCHNLTTIKGIIDMKSCIYFTSMFRNCTSLKGVKIKNPPDNFEAISGLSKSQYTVVS